MMKPSSNTQITLKLNNIGHRFRLEDGSGIDGAPWLYRNMSCSLTGGQLVVIAGCNGSGKSTLLKLAAGILTPEEGTIELFLGSSAGGVPVAKNEVSCQLAMLAPELQLYSRMTAVENIRFFLSLRGKITDNEAMKALLTRVGLEIKSVSGKPISHLSTGMRQRIKLALMIAVDAPVWIMDEPGSNLDEAGVEMVLREAKKAAQRGRLVLIASNDSREVRAANTLIRLGGSDGVVVQNVAVNLERTAEYQEKAHVAGSLFDEVRQLVKKEITIGFRNKAAWGAMLMFAVTTLACVSLTLQGFGMEPRLQSALLWIVIFFASMAGADRGFADEAANGTLSTIKIYARPQAVLFGKLIYNLLLLLMLTILTVPLYMVLMDVSAVNPLLFIMTVLGGVWGISVAGTLLSSLTTVAGPRSGLFSVLMLPIVLPVLLMAVAVCSQLFGVEPVAIQYIGGMYFFAVILTVASSILFDYVWPEL